MFVLRFTVNKNFVGAATQLPVYQSAVNKRKRTVFSRVDMSVISGCAWIVEDYVVVWSAAYRALHLRCEFILPLPAACVGDFKDCHSDESV
jgi:hypothetical protein